MLRLSPARCSCVSQMHSPLCCDLLLRHRPDRYRHLNLNRIYLLRCNLRRCAVVTIAASCTIVAAAPSPAAARHCHSMLRESAAIASCQDRLHRPQRPPLAAGWVLQGWRPQWRRYLSSTRVACATATAAATATASLRSEQASSAPNAVNPKEAEDEQDRAGEPGGAARA